MFIEDYDIRLKRCFLGNRNIWLKTMLGVEDEGLEIKVYNGFFNSDIFFLYKYNKTHMWSGYHGSTRLYKNWYSIINDICSAEIFGLRVLIPCDPLRTIIEDYGKNWSLPIESGYGWNSLRHNEWKVYGKNKWPKSRKYYDYYGKLDVKGTLEELNNHVGEDGLIRTDQISDDVF
jgi:hypothetical protein